MKVIMIDNTGNQTRMIADDSHNHFSAPIAEDPRSRAVLNIALRAAKSHATVLITGETGVGKEVVANYIHLNSHFSQGPFVSVNCAALPENMIESILFGYEKGAFTSAINTYVGKFEQAQNGTLLLDEISEISIGLQAKLLRVLQEREIERLGGRKTIKINLRIIAATNRNLHQQVEKGLFRKDLYYRLNVMPIECLALRDRRMDIIPLAEHFIKQHASAMDKQIPVLTQAAKNKLMDATWPGNIREMDNIIQRTLIMTDAVVLDENDLAFCGSSNLSDSDDANQFSSPLEANEAKLIMDVLKETDGCRNRAATKLNISSRTLRYKISKLRSIGLAIP